MIHHDLDFEVMLGAWTLLLDRMMMMMMMIDGMNQGFV